MFRQYRGARDKDSFISFVEDKKWSQVEEVSSWKDPSSLQMTMVSYFFKLSMVLRNVHTTLTDEYQVSCCCCLSSSPLRLSKEGCMQARKCMWKTLTSAAAALQQKKGL